MMELVLGAAGAFLALLFFLVGAGIGYSVGGRRGHTWLKENGCFLCCEKAKDPFGDPL